MEKARFALLLLAACCVCGAFGQIRNYPLPQCPDTLRILGLGNSFTDDGMVRLTEVLDSAGVHNVVLGRMYIGGCSLQRHVEEYARDAPAYVYSKSGPDNRWRRVSDHYRSSDALRDEPWDVVVIQQVSGMSGQYDTFEPWLTRLMQIIRKDNPTATIAWQQTWAYASDSQHPDFPNYHSSQPEMYAAIQAATARLRQETPITVVIPTGETIQRMRQMLADPGGRQCTRDGYHLGYGAPRYEAARTWYDTLVKPVVCPSRP